jgi:hypothetical protein
MMDREGIREMKRKEFTWFIRLFLTVLVAFVLAAYPHPMWFVRFLCLLILAMIAGWTNDAMRDWQAKIPSTNEREVEHTLDLIRASDDRAIRMWQEAHPDQKNIWPDRGKMIFWLMERLDHIRGVEDES